jgi:hypothetical protein
MFLDLDSQSSVTQMQPCKRKDSLHFLKFRSTTSAEVQTLILTLPSRKCNQFTSYDSVLQRRLKIRPYNSHSSVTQMQPCKRFASLPKIPFYNNFSLAFFLISLSLSHSRSLSDKYQRTLQPTENQKILNNNNNSSQWRMQSTNTRRQLCDLHTVMRSAREFKYMSSRTITYNIP